MGSRHPHPLEVRDLLGISGDHVVEQLPAHARINRVDLDAKALRPPPGFKPLLCRPELPKILDGGVVAAFEGDRRSCGWGNIVRHILFSFCLRVRALLFAPTAWPNRSSRASQRLR